MQQAEQTSDLESDVETCSRRLKAGLVGAAKVAQDLRARRQYLPQGCANIDASDLISLHVQFACVSYISVCHTSVSAIHQYVPYISMCIPLLCVCHTVCMPVCRCASMCHTVCIPSQYAGVRVCATKYV